MLDPGSSSELTSVTTLVTGTLFLMGSAADHGTRPGNGVSIIIFAGIAAGLPNALGGLFSAGQYRHASGDGAVHLLPSWSPVTAPGDSSNVVGARSGESSAKRHRQQGVWRAGSHLPPKLNMSGVITGSSRRASSCSWQRWLVRRQRGHGLAQGRRGDAVARQIRRM